MIKKIVSVMIAMSFFASCASTSQVNKGPFKPKSFVTPWEYYSKSRTADFTPEDEAEVRKADAVHTMGDDTKSDKTHYIIIGVVVGVVVIGGTVATILLTR